VIGPLDPGDDRQAELLSRLRGLRGPHPRRDNRLGQAELLATSCE
jgi:hypothetical protein